MSLELVLQVATDASIPSERQIQRWAQAALSERNRRTGPELVVRLVDEDESRALNQRYRCKPEPTNVLSFPFEAPPGMAGGCDLLGDLVICAPVIAAEAVEQNKTLEAHWAHIVIHGVLHLQGYDHQDDAQARHMEDLEIRLLAALGYADPYGDSREIDDS